MVFITDIYFVLGLSWDFTKQNDSDPSSYVTPYDYSSIMHYGDAFASKNDEKTLVPKQSGVSQKFTLFMFLIRQLIAKTNKLFEVALSLSGTLL